MLCSRISFRLSVSWVAYRITYSVCYQFHIYLHPIRAHITIPCAA
nr:MAG TPA: hypothetical protein [Caudoviricetes sp.]